MKKLISYMLILGMFFGIETTKTFAEEISNQDDSSAEEITNNKNIKETSNIEEIDASKLKIGDKFRINNGTKEYTVVEEDTDNIYLNSINGKDSIKLNINHFEVSTEANGKATWRKYVNLNDLCSKTKICENKIFKTAKYGTEVSIQRKYENPILDTVEGEEIVRPMYYATNHNIGTKKFTSLLFIGNGSEDSPLTVGYETDETMQRGMFYRFGDTKGTTNVTSPKLDNAGNSTLVDVESFIDSTDQVYISLRFLSEALGCRVDWLSSGNDSDPDDVLIRFYDSDSYCKNMNINYVENNMSSDEMYNHILEKAGLGENFNVNVDINYRYWDDNRENIQNGNARWKNIYLSGNALKYQKENISGGHDEASLIQWFSDKDDKENILKSRIHFYGETQAKEGEVSPFIEACTSNVEDDKLTSLEGCVDVTGIIMYYGVPIPVKLLTRQPQMCSIDSNTFQKLK